MEEDVMRKPIPKHDYHLKNGAGAGHRSDMTPAEYRWLETLGREPYYEPDRNSDVNSIGGTMWESTAYV